MPLFNTKERRFVAILSQLIYSNPFLPERIELEKELLGDKFAPAPWVYHKVDDLDHEHPNLTELDGRVEKLAMRARQSLVEGLRAGQEELQLYNNLISYLIYRRFRNDLIQTMAHAQAHPGEAPRVIFWKQFLADLDYFVTTTKSLPPSDNDPAYVLSAMFQVRRAFYQIYHHIAGASAPSARLRGEVWRSIFTHNMERYLRVGFYERMGQFPTLITGPSGTGKELVAKAIGLARYIPFDPKTEQFKSSFVGAIHGLNLSALVSTLVESELFGHTKAAFNGAVERKGWLEKCGEGTLFLDEIGDLDPTIQVKLLRVLQERKFHRVGTTDEGHFHGKIIAATNRDLAAEMHAGNFREDFFFRLCGDMITTPSLREQLADCPDDLSNFIRFIIKKGVTNDEQDIEELAGDVESWIRNDKVLGNNYDWPGNFRELEQCVWNVLIRNEYHPTKAARSDDPRRALADDVLAARLTADELERRYFTLVYAQTGSYQEAARILNRDWRIVKSKIDGDLYARLKPKSR
jgi:hypothetical protein